MFRRFCIQSSHIPTAGVWGTQHFHWCKQKTKAGPSLRLKNGYGQDDTAFFICGVILLLSAFALAGCRSAQRDPRTVVFLIESSPTSLDPRVGTDVQSEHIDELIFDGLVQRDASFHFTPALAERWEQPDPKTVIFHLRQGVHFHDGRALTSRDVLWTLNSMHNGTLITAKAASYA